MESGLGPRPDGRRCCLPCSSRPARAPSTGPRRAPVQRTAPSAPNETVRAMLLPPGSPPQRHTPPAIRPPSRTIPSPPAATSTVSPSSNPALLAIPPTCRSQLCGRRASSGHAGSFPPTPKPRSLRRRSRRRDHKDQRQAHQAGKSRESPEPPASVGGADKEASPGRVGACAAIADSASSRSSAVGTSVLGWASAARPWASRGGFSREGSIPRFGACPGPTLRPPGRCRHSPVP